METTFQRKISRFEEKSLTSNMPLIMLRKKQSTEQSIGGSVLYFDRGASKLAFTLRNDSAFLQKDNVDSTIKQICSKFSEDNINNLKEKVAEVEKLIQGKINSLDVMRDLPHARTGNEDFSNQKLLNPVEKEDHFANANSKYIPSDMLVLNQSRDELKNTKDPLHTSKIIKKKDFEKEFDFATNPIKLEQSNTLEQQGSKLKDIKAVKRHSEVLDMLPNSIRISRKNILNLFEKLKSIEEEKEKKGSEKNSLNMKKIVFRKSETIKKPNYSCFKNAGSIGTNGVQKTENNNPVLESEIKSFHVENYFDSNYNSLICFVCDLIISKERAFKFTTCNHIFCDKCGKSFYEEKIEQGEKNLKCPSFKCQSVLDESLIPNLVSEMHLSHFKKEAKGDTNNIVNYLTNNTNTTSPSLLPSKPIKTIMKKSTIVLKQDFFKMYSQKHVLDITTQDSFLVFNRAKEQFCIKCYEPALFGKIGKNYIKCLNCSQFTCKFCMKELGTDHFDLSSNNYCKIFFRKKTFKVIEPSGFKCVKAVINSVAVYLFSYIFFVCGTIYIIDNFLDNLLRPVESRIGCIPTLMRIIFWLLVGSVLTLLFWLIIPFFPIMIAVFQ